MTASFSRTQFPPGGWQFHQAHTGWSNPHPMMTTFDQCVQAIIKHRTQNPALCLKHGLSKDPVVVGNELENFTRLRCGIPAPAPPAQPAILPGVAAGVVGSVDEIKRLALGSSILVAWEESGDVAVDQGVAEERARVCAACPLNSVQKYEEWLRHPLTGMLKYRMVRVSAMKLSTRSDARLGLCEGLYCPTPILVHEPSGIVTKKMEQKGSVKLDDSCWLKSQR